MKQKIHIAIGSKNPCKIDAVKKAFHKVFEQQLNLNLDTQTQTQTQTQTKVQTKVQTQLDNQSTSNPNYELVFSCHNVPSKVNDQPIGDDETLLGAKNRALAAFEIAQGLYDASTHNSSSNSNNSSNSNDEDCYGAPDFGVGLEGGIEIQNKSTKDETQLWCMAWMAIVGTNSTICTSCKHESSTFEISSDNTNDNNNDNDTTMTMTNSSKEQTKNTKSDNLKWGISKTASFQLPQKIADLIMNNGMELGHADDAVFNRVNSKHGSGTVGVLTNDLISRCDYYDHALVLALISFIWPEHY